MGVPSGSLETSYRVLKNWIDIITPRAVFLFTPPSWRREIIKEKEIDLVFDGHPLADNLKRVSSFHSDNNHRDYMVKAIGYHCAEYRAKLFVIDNLAIEQTDYGNDGMHPGPATNRFIANRFHSYWKRQFNPKK